MQTAIAHPITDSHNYVWKLIELLTARAFELRPGLTSFHVEHDDWCQIFAGGFCNCDPVVSMRCLTVECVPMNTDKTREKFIKLLRKRGARRKL